jgi:RNA polymerase sigma factor (sigma-70 family)
MAPTVSSLVRSLQQSLLEQELALLSDAQLVARFVDVNDQSAFSLLITRHGGLVQSVCQRILRNSSLVDDAVQATFILLARKGITLSKRESLASWLFGVARRVAWRARDQQSLREHHEHQAGILRESTSSQENQWDELLNILDEELRRLAPCYQAPLLACYYRGLTQDEAARELGWPLITLRRRLEKARTILKDRLSRRGATLSSVLFAGILSESNLLVAMSSDLRQRTLQNVSAISEGQAISSQIEVLVLGTLPMFHSLKWTVTFAFVLIGSISLMGFLWAQLPKENQDQKNAKTVQLKSAKDSTEIKKDSEGNSLPKGAIARLGSMKFNHGDRLNGLFFSPDGKKIISTSKEWVRVWDSESGRELSNFNPIDAKDQAATDALFQLSEDGKKLYSLSEALPDTFRVYDVETGKLLTEKALNIKRGGWSVHRRNALSRNGKWGVSNVNRAVSIFDLESGEEKFKLPKNVQDDHTLVFTGDNKYLVSCDPSNIIEVWELETGNRIRDFGNGKLAKVLVASPNGKWLATLEHHNYAIDRFLEKDVVHIWDLSQGKEIQTLDVDPKSWIMNLVFSEQSDRIAAIIITETNSLLKIWDVTTGAVVREMKFIYGTRIAFSPDGKRFVEGGLPGQFTVWDLEKGTPVVSRTSPDLVGDLVFSESPNHSIFTVNNHSISEWNRLTGKELRTFQMGGKIRSFPRSCFSPNGKFAVSASGKIVGDDLKGTMSIWDIQSGKLLHELTSPDQTLGSDHLFSPDSRFLITLRSQARTKTTCIWDVATGKLLRTFSDPKGHFMSLQILPDGKTILLLGERVVAIDFESGKERFSWTLRIQGVKTEEDYRKKDANEIDKAANANEPSGIHLRSTTLSPDGNEWLSCCQST